jgi:hypothetical protein
MLKIVLIIVAVLALLLVATLVVAATKPNSFRVQRSAAIEAPPEKLQAIVEDFQTWGKWSPYEKVDPDMKRTFSGPTAGKGAVYEWDGDGNIGAGRMEILQSTPEGIEIQFEMSRPMECHNVIRFDLEPVGDATNVTWIMEGPNSYMGKIMQTFFSMETMVGTQQEKGLADLKSLAEGSEK